MSEARLEHLNVTVADPEATAALLCTLFGWRVRWQGPSQLGGRTVHVGSADTYLALWTRVDAGRDADFDADFEGGARRGLGHVGVVVDDLDAVAERVRAAGLEPHTFGDYDPGRRFYFDGPDGVEYEVVSYG